MNFKRIIIKVIILTAILAVFWWFLPPPSTPVKVASTSPASKLASIPESQYPIDPKSPALHPPPSAPLAPAPPKTPQSSQAPSPPITPSVDPQADLKTAIPDIARLYRAGGQAAVAEIYTPPEELGPEALQAIRAMQAGRAQQDASSRQLMQRMGEAFAQAVESLANQTPILNANGDEATYMVMTPTASDMQNGVFTATNNSEPLQHWVFVKINGKWYLKSRQGT